MAQSNDKIPKRNVVPDRLDLRDRPYLPSISVHRAMSCHPNLRCRC